MSTEKNNTSEEHVDPKEEQVAGPSNGIRSAEDFNFTLPVAVRRNQLLNNKYLSDVTFKVGEAGTLIYAHKIIVTVASKALFSLLNNPFNVEKTEGADPAEGFIRITDIEPEIFMEVLRYIYYEKVNLNAKNMLDIYYASEKYLLYGLSSRCKRAFKKEITDQNVLKVLQNNRKRKINIVDKICLDIICDNPIAFFKMDDFLALKQDALLMITTQSAINCQPGDMQKAIDMWEEKNGKSGAKVNVQQVLCKNVNFFSEVTFNANINTSFRLNVHNPIALYGLGILVGAEEDLRQPAEIEIIVVLDNETLIAQKVPIPKSIKIYEIMFEKRSILNKCVIQVKIKKPDKLEDLRMVHYIGLQLAMTELQSHCLITCCDPSFLSTSKCAYCNNVAIKPTINCVSYFMCEAITNTESPGPRLPLSM